MPTVININEKNVKRPIGDIEEITSIHFGPNVESIDHLAFEDSQNLETVTFDPECKLLNIEPFTFVRCKKLKSITLPNSVTKIEDGAFNWCESLSSINIPDSVEKVETCAFLGCSSLKTVTIGKNVSTIKGGAFCESYNLTEINLPKSKINDLDFSKPDQIRQEQLNEFKKDLMLPKYCNVKVDGKIIEPDSNAKIEQCKAILANGKYTNELKTVIGSQLAHAYYKAGDFKQASDLLKKLKPLEEEHLANCPEWKKQCEQIRESITTTKAREKITDFSKEVKLVSQCNKTLHNLQQAQTEIKEIGPKKEHGRQK